MIIANLLPERIALDQLGIGELVTDRKYYSSQDGVEERKDSPRLKDTSD